ncbi:MAG TPA: hypothetical protein PK624_14020 [Spirochaetota bacterium]|nr:hypothetical protein [Spirochaetota bacterium]HPK57553.1 hypothetical protein [Spirochaetota bacterium]
MKKILVMSLLFLSNIIFSMSKKPNLDVIDYIQYINRNLNIIMKYDYDDRLKVENVIIDIYSILDNGEHKRIISSYSDNLFLVNESGKMKMVISNAMLDKQANLNQRDLYQVDIRIYSTMHIGWFEVYINKDGEKQIRVISSNEISKIFKKMKQSKSEN